MLKFALPAKKSPCPRKKARTKSNDEVILGSKVLQYILYGDKRSTVGGIHDFLRIRDNIYMIDGYSLPMQKRTE